MASLFASLFEEADLAADVLRKRPGFMPEDLQIMLRLAQRHHHPNYSDDQVAYLFDIWHDGYEARPRRRGSRGACPHARAFEKT